jgi:hypothetical protein
LDAEQRVTFRRLATEAQSALHATDSGPAEEAMELMIDLACHADGCFRSDDPLEAAKFVVSQADLAGVPGRPREDHPGGRLFRDRSGRHRRSHYTGDTASQGPRRADQRVRAGGMKITG